jgi:DeoR family transcriptional regulator of aga operon
VHNARFREEFRRSREWNHSGRMSTCRFPPGIWARLRDLTIREFRVLAEKRRTLLTDEINRVGQIVTSEIAARLGVSEVTVRADLEDLERRGRVTRTHGGAVPADSGGPIIAFNRRLALGRNVKRKIAAAAAEYVQADQTVIFDTGTTVFNLAQGLPSVTGLTVFTANIPAAQYLLKIDGVETHLLGGRIDPAWFATVGTPREQGIEDVFAHTLFLGVQGIDDDLDIIDASREMARNKQQFARRARSVVLLADSSKWNRNGPAKVMPLSDVNVVITDAGIPAAVRRRVEALGLELRVVR